MKIPSPSLFTHLPSDCKPTAVKSKSHTKDDEEFIKKETQRLLNEGIIKPRKSPWTAQVLVTKETERYKKRIVIDYSQRINRYTELDVYPLSRIDDRVIKILKYSDFSTLSKVLTTKFLFLRKINLILHLKQLQNYMNFIVYLLDLLMVYQRFNTQ